LLEGFSDAEDYFKPGIDRSACLCRNESRVLVEECSALRVACMMSKTSPI